METPLSSTLFAGIPERKQSLLAKYHVGTVAKVLMYAVLVLVVLNVYCKMRLVVQLLHTMLVGWSIMLDVLIQSNMLDGPERLEELIQVIMSYTGGI